MEIALAVVSVSVWCRTGVSRLRGGHSEKGHVGRIRALGGGGSQTDRVTCEGMQAFGQRLRAAKSRLVGHLSAHGCHSGRARRPTTAIFAGSLPKVKAVAGLNSISLSSVATALSSEASESWSQALSSLIILEGNYGVGAGRQNGRSPPGEVAAAIISGLALLRVLFRR